jgi:3-hydroxybutyryl-CoA dehydrogenase
VAVLGTGVMGQGIAQVAAQSGFVTRIWDVDTARTTAAIAAIEKQLARLVEKKKISEDQRKETLARLAASGTVEDACTSADVIIEAAPEKMQLKVDLLAKAAAAAPATALVGSNTSSLSITELGARLGLADRTIGLHFFNPPPVMELLEIVRGLGTSEATVERALELSSRLGKSPIVVRDTPGFATSRLGVMLGAEAIRMVEAGVASPADIDKGMELGYRHPMGPLKLTDLIGLDVRLAVLEHLHKEVGEQFRPPVLLRQMVRAGKLGKKTGEGFYVWKDGVPHPK